MSFNIENLRIKDEVEDASTPDVPTETQKSEKNKVSTPPVPAPMPTDEPQILVDELPHDTKLKLLKMFYLHFPESPEFSPFIDEAAGFTWTVRFPVDPTTPHNPNAFFKYDFLPIVTFKLDSTINVPSISVNNGPALPVLNYFPPEMLPLFGGAALN